MLEKEMPLLRELDQKTILGGSMPMTTTPLSNGYCFFNALSYSFEGSNNDASDYLNSFVNQYGTSSEVYDKNGDLLGFALSGQQMLDFMNSSGGYYSSSVGTNLNDIANILSGGTGNEVMGVIQSQGPHGENVTHDVMINQVNSDGSYNYFDPTDNMQYNNVTTSITFAFSMEPEYVQ